MYAGTKRYKYLEYDEEGDKEVIITEKEIINDYFPFWLEKIYTVETPAALKLRECSRKKQIEACIDNFIVVHWAVEVKDD